MSITDLWMRFLSFALGWRWVWVEMAGEVSICRIRWIGGRPFVKIYGFRNFLLDGGKISGRCYVLAWRPYELGAASTRRWPTPPQSA